MSAFHVIDLFAGPGGLGEGFASSRDKRHRNQFEIGLSIEKDVTAHSTLLLRAVYRRLKSTAALSRYHQFIAGRITNSEFVNDPIVAEAFRLASIEARCAELGKDSPAKINDWIASAVGAQTDWVLIGGPPCQAYSLAGRSRRTNDTAFEEDEKHFLYREYLRILRKFEPAVFVMENVKGMLSATHGGASIFARITSELSRPKAGLDYELRSFVCEPDIVGHSPMDYLIRADQYCVPQMRHRVILLGVRRDYASRRHELLQPLGRDVTVQSILAGLPPLRSTLSKDDSFEHWHAVLGDTARQLRGWKSEHRAGIESVMMAAVSRAASMGQSRAKAKTAHATIGSNVPAELAAWMLEDAPQTPCQHEARGHMASDLQRYLFAASYAAVAQRSPKLADFPVRLLPAHANARAQDAPNTDRFRVQLFERPSSTIVSHISKDGHYYIHPDPHQCRSLTVREAARLQTFPDNYFFMGPRTAQYAQVGNAVPPYLARQIAKVVAGILTGSAG